MCLHRLCRNCPLRAALQAVFWCSAAALFVPVMFHLEGPVQDPLDGKDMAERHPRYSTFSVPQAEAGEHVVVVNFLGIHPQRLQHTITAMRYFAVSYHSTGKMRHTPGLSCCASLLQEATLTSVCSMVFLCIVCRGVIPFRPLPAGS